MRSLQGSRSVVAWPAFKNESKNPYNALLYRELIRQGWVVREFAFSEVFRPRSAFHVHWPEEFDSTPRVRSSLVRLLALLLTALSRRAFQQRVVWTAHNLGAHEPKHPRLRVFYKAVFPRLVTDVIHLSAAAQARFQADSTWSTFSGQQHIVPHGPYVVNMLARPKKNDGLRVLALGQVRSYKGLNELSAAWAHTAPESWRLVIAGTCDDGALRARLEEHASGDVDGKIELLLSWQSDHEVDALLSESDAVVVSGQRDNSGLIFLGLSAHRRVLAPRNASTEEMQRRYGSEWILLYDKPSEIVQIMYSATQKEVPLMGPKLDSWKSIAKLTAEVYVG